MLINLITDWKWLSNLIVKCVGKTQCCWLWDLKIQFWNRHKIFTSSYNQLEFRSTAFTWFGIRLLSANYFSKLSNMMAQLYSDSCILIEVLVSDSSWHYLTVDTSFVDPNWSTQENSLKISRCFLTFIIDFAK